VIGDYVGGPNHVLPTGRSARFASGLSVYDFLKRTTLLACSADSLRVLGPAAARLARAEGLAGHARAVERRLGVPKPA
jgi:histidinol dehydrogenase